MCSARSRVRGHIEVYAALVGRVGEAEEGEASPAPADGWEMVEPETQTGTVQPVSSCCYSRFTLFKLYVNIFVSLK